MVKEGTFSVAALHSYGHVRAVGGRLQTPMGPNSYPMVNTPALSPGEGFSPFMTFGKIAAWRSGWGLVYPFSNLRHPVWVSCLEIPKQQCRVVQPGHPDRMVRKVGIFRPPNLVPKPFRALRIAPVPAPAFSNLQTHVEVAF